MLREAAHLLVLVQRVDDQLHHPVHLRLESVLLRLLPDLFDLRSVQPVQLDRLLLPFIQNMFLFKHF